MGPSSTPFGVSISCWFALEIGLLVRDIVRRKVRFGGDRGTRAAVSLSIGAGIVGGSLVRGAVPVLDTPAPGVFAVVGLVVFWIGLAVRLWAVLALGGAFSTFIQVEGDQQVVTRGPYRWVRHPSYTGLLLISAGLGIALGNWLSMVVCTVVPLLGLLRRMAVEERELVRVLGEPYREYQQMTRRLVPGLW